MFRKLTSHGFTLTELVIAISLFGLIIPIIALSVTELTILNARSRNILLANTAAQNKVETLRSQGFNSIPTGTVDFSSELSSLLSSPKTASYTITNSTASIKDVSITISFRDGTTTRTTQYQTSISELGVGQ